MHRPSGANIRAREKLIIGIGVRITFTPPTSARSQSPESSAWQAWCSATNDELQAVSTIMAGPFKPSRKLIRPAPAAGEQPVPEWKSMSSNRDSRTIIPANSCVDSPMKTPVWVPASAEGAIPACSIADHVVSSISRCCGSMNIASRADTPKNGASKPDDVIDEPRPASHHLPRRIGIGVVELVGIPPIRRHDGHRISAVGHELPEFTGVGGPGETKRVAQHRERPCGRHGPTASDAPAPGRREGSRTAVWCRR